MPMPSKKGRTCTLDMLPTASKPASGGQNAAKKAVKKVSLFEQRRLRGFWPCASEAAGQQQILAVSSQIFSRTIIMVCLLPKFDHWSLWILEFLPVEWRSITKTTVAKYHVSFCHLFEWAFLACFCFI